MSVTEADAMMLMGETQESTVGGRQADISAAIERQYAYEQDKAAEFGTGSGLPLSAVPFVTGSALGSISVIQIGAPGTPATQLWQQPPGDPQVNFPPSPDSRIYVPGTEPTPSNRLPVPYEPPTNTGPWTFPIGGIGVILSGVIAGMWTGWPNALGDEPGPYDTRAPRAAPQDPTNVPDTGEFGPVPPGELGPPRAGETYDNPPYPTIPQFPGDTGSVMPEDIDFGPIPDSGYGPPQGARQPQPTPTTVAGPTLPAWVWPVIGGLAAIQLGRRSRSSMTLPEISLSPPSVTLINEPLISAAQLGQASPATLTAGSGFYDEERCNCSPKKRGKQRKCLARAQLSWRSGPKKGKAAGSRCYRYAQ